MNQSVEVLEDILACSLVNLRGINSDFCTILGVLPSILIFTQGCLEEVVLLLQKSEVLIKCTDFVDCSRIEMSFHVRFKSDQSSPIIFELEGPPVDGLLGAVELIPELVSPLSQQSEDRRVINFELIRLNILLCELPDPNWYLMTNEHLFPGLFQLSVLLAIDRWLVWI